MSAYIVGHDHIDALLTFAAHERVSYFTDDDNRVEITPDNATEIGRILLAENERSVQHRYPGDAPDDLAGTVGERAANYQFKEFGGAPQPALTILKGCDCFDYQACETDDYTESLACKIVDAIRRRAIIRLPAYTNSPGWEIDRP